MSRERLAKKEEVTGERGELKERERERGACVRGKEKRGLMCADTDFNGFNGRHGVWRPLYTLFVLGI